MSDLIKRSDAIETAYQLRRKPNDEEWDWWVRSFNAIPSADRPQGEWIDIGGYEVCKNCHEVKRFPHWNYCPLCGADMRKGADDETRNETV